MKPNDVWYTRPAEVNECLAHARNSTMEFGLEAFDLDPCAGNFRDTPLCFESMWYGKEYPNMLDRGSPPFKWDGLRFDWWGHVFVNPPFSELETWIDMARQQIDRGVHSIAMIVPNTRLESACVNDLLYESSHIVSLRVMKRRRPFINPVTLEPMKSPRFGISSIVILPK